MGESGGLRITLLGTFEVRRGDTVVPVPGARLRNLLTRLALAGGRPVDPATLVEALWPEDQPADPANALQSLVSRLRKLLGGGIEGTYRLDITDSDVDALRFEKLSAEGRTTLRAGDPRTAAELLAEAVSLWSGPTNAGTGPPSVAAVAPAVATRLARESVETIADLAAAETALDEAATAEARLTVLLAENPVHERVAALLIDALAAQGRQAEALAVYERIRESLADALGADPGAALRERHRQLLHKSDISEMSSGMWRGGRQPGEGQTSRARSRGEWGGGPARVERDGGGPARGEWDGGGTGRGAQEGGAAGRAGSAGGGASGDGEVRTGTGRAHGEQVGESRPRGEWDGRARAAGSNLPAALTSFVGRDDDLARIESLLADGRLVTVLGPGGAGKTRLALEAARRLRHEYRFGTWMVDLASVTEPGKVGGAFLAAVGVRTSALFDGRMKPDATDVDALTDELGGRESLLLVDNCEHLIEAVAFLVADLLPRCPGLRVLATSREPLAVDGEALVPLGPLTLPAEQDGAEQARRAAAVRLFTERAAAVRPGFDVDEDNLADVLRVVCGLDGMPLALELAAARLRTLSLAELAAGLSDRFRLLTTGNRTALPRHRTLRAVIAWSWDLLGEDERTVAERVSVLPGGVTAASAAAVCEGTAADIPELLATLVDRSILQLAPEPGRYRMLETLREYGIERLAEQGTLDAVRGMAARHLTGIVARADGELRSAGQLGALTVMRAEYDNALAALRHLCDAGDAEGAVELAGSLAWYWQMLGRHTDAVYWLGEALAIPFEGHTLDRDCAEAIMVLNRISTRSELIGEAGNSDGEGQAELRRLADRLVSYPELPGLSGALTAITLFFLEEFDTSLAIVQRLADGDDPWLAGLAHLFRAQFAENRGDLDTVRRDVDASLVRFEQAGDRWGQATALPLRALLRQYDGDLDGALVDLTRARRLAREFGSLSMSDEIFIDLRWIDLHLRRGETEQARALIVQARERALRTTSPELTILVNALEAGMWLRLDELDRARDRVEMAEAGLAGGISHAGDHGRAIIGAVRAALCVAEGDGPGAEVALARAYAGAVESRDMPIVAMVTITAAGLADLYERHRDTALLLGAASRLRGTHDHTDPLVRKLSRSCRAAIGDEGFTQAYEIGWKLDGTAALNQVDPARLRRVALPAGNPEPTAQARRE